MIALDTNIVVRFLTVDDAGQAAKAKALIEANPVYLSKTVLLASEWVLRSGYGFAAGRIAAAFRALCGLPGVAIEDWGATARAFDWYDQGLDFADALHLASSSVADSFATFDKTLARRSQALDQVPQLLEP